MYTPTLGVEVHPIAHRGVVFNFWDLAGDERYEGLRDGYIILAFEGYNPVFEDYLEQTKHLIVSPDTNIDRDILDLIVEKLEN